MERCSDGVQDEEHDLDAQLMSQLLLIKRIREEAHLYTATRDPAGCGDGRPLHVVGLSAYKDTQARPLAHAPALLPDHALMHPLRHPVGNPE